MAGYKANLIIYLLQSGSDFFFRFLICCVKIYRSKLVRVIILPTFCMGQKLTLLYSEEERF
jgi:hypothetical protein